MGQFNIRIDDDLHERFRRACDARHTSMAPQVELLMDCFATAVEKGEIRHADGSPCPVTAMIDNLAKCAASQLMGVSLSVEWMKTTREDMLKIMRESVDQLRLNFEADNRAAIARRDAHPHEGKKR